jgi:hypothetical protein
MFQKQVFMFNEDSTSEGDAVVSSEGLEAPKQEPVSSSKKFKVNGREIEVPQEKLDYYAQLGLSANEKWQEAANMRKEAEKVLSTAKTEKSAIKALEAAGYSRADAQKVIEDELRRIYEEEDMSPEEKAKRAQEEELAQYRQAEAERKRLIEEEANSKEEQKYLEQLDNEIAEAIAATDLPKNPILGKFALNYMNAFAQQGEELSAKDAIKFVSNDFKLILRDMIGNMDSKSLKEYLKPEHLKGFQQESVAEYRSKQQPFAKGQVPANQAPAKEEEKGKEYVNSRQFFKANRFN